MLEKLPRTQQTKGFAFCTLLQKYAVATGGQISANDGEAGSGTTIVERYDLTLNSWVQLPNMNEPRVNHASCAMDDTLYVFCGQNNGTDLGSVEKLIGAG